MSTAAGHIVERLPHGELVQTPISKCAGSSDEHSTYLANSRMAVRWRLRSFVVPCHRSSGLLVPRCQGSRLHEVDVPDRVRVCTRLWHVLDIHG